VCGSLIANVYYYGERCWWQLNEHTKTLHSTETLPYFTRGVGSPPLLFSWNPQHYPAKMSKKPLRVPDGVVAYDPETGDVECVCKRKGAWVGQGTHASSCRRNNPELWKPPATQRFLIYNASAAAAAAGAEAERRRAADDGGQQRRSRRTSAPPRTQMVRQTTPSCFSAASHRR